MDLQERAAQLARYLVVNNKEGERQGIIVKADDAPEWVTDVVHAVHGDSFPDDWTYAAIRDAASAIEEDGEDATVEADIYNRQLIEWAADYPNADDYCRQAIEDYGFKPTGLYDLLQYAQGIAYGEVVSQVIAQLEGLGDDEPEEEDTEDLYVCTYCGQSAPPDAAADVDVCDWCVFAQSAAKGGE